MQLELVEVDGRSAAVSVVGSGFAWVRRPGSIRLMRWPSQEIICQSESDDFNAFEDKVEECMPGLARKLFYGS